ncbi:MAG: Gfo/Idh/MocA family oxidoreductase [Bacteroidales bacterium]|nr:Gfo/Idh/MocA family oxidoreductase [Bacteroidales bacterium]
MLKIGVLGAGHLGKIHIHCIRQTKDFELVGFYDPDEKRSEAVAKEFGLKRFSGLGELLESVDVVDIVSTTTSHYEVACRALKMAKHIFIEKPVAANPEEAKSLLSIANEANVKVQVGHVERFNPAFTAARAIIDNPMFIETHRLAQFNPRGTDVSVVLDLMIHDIDIVLSVVPSNIKKISASGVAVVTDTPDITNARIEFDNGSVANLTASRISMKNMRKSRFFQKNAYISVDFLEKETEIIRLKDIVPGTTPDPLAMTIDLPDGKGTKQIYLDKPSIKPVNAIKDELESFAGAIRRNTTPVVTLEDGCRALEVAYKIMDKINAE